MSRRLGLAVLLLVMVAGLVLSTAGVSFFEHCAANVIETAFRAIAAWTVVEEAR